MKRNTIYIIIGTVIVVCYLTVLVHILSTRI